jgi:hypothetical protein
MTHHDLHQVALTRGAAKIDSRLADLREDIAIWRELYVVAGVTEIATLRAQLGGPQVG